jgi:hypothetical protein
VPRWEKTFDPDALVRALSMLLGLQASIRPVRQAEPIRLSRHDAVSPCFWQRSPEPHARVELESPMSDVDASNIVRCDKTRVVRRNGQLIVSFAVRHDAEYLVNMTEGAMK